MAPTPPPALVTTSVAAGLAVARTNLAAVRHSDSPTVGAGLLACQRPERLLRLPRPRDGMHCSGAFRGRGTPVGSHASICTLRVSHAACVLCRLMVCLPVVHATHATPRTTDSRVHSGHAHEPCSTAGARRLQLGGRHLPPQVGRHQLPDGCLAPPRGQGALVAHDAARPRGGGCLDRKSVV